MNVNFHNLMGEMPVGLDIHLYFSAVPPTPTGVPMPCPHATTASFVFPCRIWRLATKVWVMFTPGLQSSWARLVFAHVPPFVPPPHASEAASLLTTIGTSSSAPVMTVHSVKGQGAALMTCLAACAGLNQNCGMFVSGGPTLNITSVKTTPTRGDYAAAAVGFALNAIVNTATAAIQQNPISIAVAVAQNLDDLGDAYDVHLPIWAMPLSPIMAAARAVSAGVSAATSATQQAVDPPPKAPGGTT